MNRAARRALLVIASTCGCGISLPQTIGDATWPGPCLPVLAAVSTDPSAEIAGPLSWDPESGLGVPPTDVPPGGEQPPAKVTRTRAWRWGMEAGAFIPLEGESHSYDGGLSGAAFVHIGARTAHPLGLELGIGYTSLSADGVDAETSLLLLRARGLWMIGESGLCLALGAQIAHQQASHQGQSLDAYTGGTIDMGAYYFFARRYVVGLAYSYLVESDNVPGALSATGGITFQCRLRR